MQTRKQNLQWIISHGKENYFNYSCLFYISRPTFSLEYLILVFYHLFNILQDLRAHQV